MITYDYPSELFWGTPVFSGPESWKVIGKLFSLGTHGIVPSNKERFFGWEDFLSRFIMKYPEYPATLISNYREVLSKTTGL